MERRRKTLWIIAFLIAGIVIILMSIFGTQKQQAPEHEFTSVSRGGFEVSVKTIGTLEATRATYLGSEISSDAPKIVYLIDDGARVEQGAVLVRFDPAPFEARVKELEARLREQEGKVNAVLQAIQWEQTQSAQELRSAESERHIAELDYNRTKEAEVPLEKTQLQRDLEEAQSQWTEAKGYVDDLIKLSERGYSHPDELEQAKERADKAEKLYQTAKMKFDSYENYQLPAKLEASLAAFRKAETNLELVKSNAAFKMTKLQTELNRARTDLDVIAQELQRARVELEKTTITAPNPGIAIMKESYWGSTKRKPHIGDAMFRGQTIFYLPDISSIMVKSRIREVDLHKVTTGMTAEIQIEAFPDKRFQGRVDFIGALAEGDEFSAQSDKYFQVDIVLSEIDDRLRPGMTAVVQINTATVTDALRLPVNAVFPRNRDSGCFVPVSNGYEWRKLETGLQNEQWIEIKSGLKEGDRVCLFMPELDEILPDTSNPTPVQTESR